MEIGWKYNVDCASQGMVIVNGQIGICSKREVPQFVFLLPGIIHCLLNLDNFGLNHQADTANFNDFHTIVDLPISILIADYLTTHTKSTFQCSFLLDLP
jgi:hypothetical protein